MLPGLQRQSLNFISYLYQEKRFISHIYIPKLVRQKLLDTFKRLFYFENHFVHTVKSEVNPLGDLMIYANYLTLQERGQRGYHAVCLQLD